MNQNYFYTSEFFTMEAYTSSVQVLKVNVKVIHDILLKKKEVKYS